MDKPEVTIDIPDEKWHIYRFLCAYEIASDNHFSECYEPTVVLNETKLYVANPARLDSFCKLECGEGMYIGKYVHIASFCHLGIGGGLLILEQGSSCASGVKIITGSNLPGSGHGCSAIDPDAIIKRSFVHVKRNATLYTNAVVCPGVTIGEGAVVLPGAVVTCDIPDGETWGGVPAKKITKKNVFILAADEVRRQKGQWNTDKEQTHMDSSGNVIYQSQIEQTHIPVKTSGMDSGEVVPVDPLFEVGKTITSDRWVESQSEMYGWDKDK